MAMGFAGYKAGMTHIMLSGTAQKGRTYEQAMPVTVIECPPVKVAAVRFYKRDAQKLQAITEVRNPKAAKILGRALAPMKNQKAKIEDIKEFDCIRLIVYTQPSLTGIGKKRPEIFEVAIGGAKDSALAYAKDVFDKEIKISDVFKAGQQLDIHAITKGKGFQGAVKRFGIQIRAHKSEKTKRGVGSLGPWKGQAHIMWRVPAAGKMGYHLRTEHNKWLVLIGNDPAKINPDGGFVNYGLVRNDFILTKGSIGGPKKRLVRFTLASRPDRNVPKVPGNIIHISTKSKQGN